MNFTKLFVLASLTLPGTSFGLDAVIPSGFLDASSLLVREDSDVNLTWEVNIPATEVEELIEIPPEDPTIIAKEDVAFNVRVLGVEYAWMGDYVRAYGQYRYGNSPFLSFFSGYGDDANSLANNTCDILRTGEELEFRFRGSRNGFRFMPAVHRTWFPYRYSSNSRSNDDNPAIILKNGDPLPDRATPAGQTDVATFLESYISDDGLTVEIGPKDLIILAELNRDLGEEGADYQDFVILVSFTEAANGDCTRRWTPAPPVVNPPTPTPPTPPTSGPPATPPAPPVIPELPDVPGNPE